MRTKQMIKASDANKRRALGKVAALAPETSTNVYDTLEFAFALAGRGGREERSGDLPTETIDTIFFLTDGLPTTGKVVDPEQIVAHVTDWNRELKLKIHTIGVGLSSIPEKPQEKARAFLQQLAAGNGGQCVLQD
jgi:hypothetical protein